MSNRKVIYTHLRSPENPGKTWCGLLIWEAIRVTENEGQVTCPDCLKSNCGQAVGVPDFTMVGVALAA